MSNVGVATKRTAWNSTVTAVVVAIIVRRFEIELTADETALAIAGFGILSGVVYRVSRAITARWPKLGWALFGSVTEPTEYTRQA